MLLAGAQMVSCGANGFVNGFTGSQVVLPSDRTGSQVVSPFPCRSPSSPGVKRFPISQSAQMVSQTVSLFVSPKSQRAFLNVRPNGFRNRQQVSRPQQATTSLDRYPVGTPVIFSQVHRWFPKSSGGLSNVSQMVSQVSRWFSKRTRDLLRFSRWPGSGLKFPRGRPSGLRILLIVSHVASLGGFSRRSSSNGFANGFRK